MDHKNHLAHSEMHVQRFSPERLHFFAPKFSKIGARESANSETVYGDPFDQVSQRQY